MYLVLFIRQKNHSLNYSKNKQENFLTNDLGKLAKCIRHDKSHERLFSLVDLETKLYPYYN